MDATEQPPTRLDPPNDPATRAGTDDAPGAVDLAEDDLVEEISIDGMCGVY